MKRFRRRKHRHFYRLKKTWNHPRGYLFICARCELEGLEPHRFITRESFWRGARPDGPMEQEA